MAAVFDSNIFLDPLTGLPNFFKFIETDVDAMFQEQGTVIIFDLMEFAKVNNHYGRDIGDLCLKSFSDAIRESLLDYKNILVFRTDGDEFTVILPNMEQALADELVCIIRKKYLDKMRKHGFSNLDVHTLTINYSEKMTSITQFYQVIFKNSLEKIKGNHERQHEDRWLEHIIESFIHRIKDTLSFYYDAYHLALTDDISGLPNQRAAKIYLNHTHASKKEFSLLFIDGDNLKRYNKISYQAGNEMIKNLSDIISKTLRRNDKVFRWLSGDEFLVVLEQVNYTAALRLAERIRNSVEINTVDWAYPVTVSIGVSCYPGDGNSIEEIVHHAERANSYAKKVGKNIVVRWDSMDHSE